MKITNQHCAFGLNFTTIESSINLDNNHSNYWFNNRYLYLNIPDVAKYHADAGDLIVNIDVANSLKNLEVINTWLYGTVLSYLLQYHGFLVIHGSAVLIDDKAVIFCGNSGVGKSTLAFAMNKLNYPTLTDDLVVIKQDSSGHLKLISSTNYVKLWQDVLDYFDKNSENLTPVLNKPGKYIVPSLSTTEKEFYISSIYELNVSAKLQPITCMNVRSIEAFKLLINNTYRYEMLKPLGQLSNHFYQITQLANTAKIFRINRPPNLFELDSLTKIIENMCSRL